MEIKELAPRMFVVVDEEGNWLTGTMKSRIHAQHYINKNGGNVYTIPETEEEIPDDILFPDEVEKEFFKW